MTALQTERLILREMEEGDLAGYAELLSDPDIHPFITEDGPVAESEVAERIGRNRAALDQLYWAIELAGEFVGYVALHAVASPSPAVSYAIRPAWRRQGLAREALEAVVRHAFSTLGARELIARTHQDNPASAGLLAGLGFRVAGSVDTPTGPRVEYRLSYKGRLAASPCHDAGRVEAPRQQAGRSVSVAAQGVLGRASGRRTTSVAGSIGSMEPGAHRSYIPAAGRDLFLRFYDPFQRWFVGDGPQRRLIEEAGISAGQRILDIGCGTGASTILVRQLHPEAEVVGIDPDPKALAIAQRKMDRAGVFVRHDLGFADELSYESGSFDRVLSSLMFHHLTRDEKLATLREALRVLRPGGSIHILDFGRPRGLYGSTMAFLFLRGGHLRENVSGEIPELMAETGFDSSVEVGHRNTFIGTLGYYRGLKPSTGFSALD